MCLVGDAVGGEGFGVGDEVVQVEGAGDDAEEGFEGEGAGGEEVEARLDDGPV
jgi:hypothetical protein